MSARTLAPIRIVGTGPVSLVLRGLLARQGFGSGELVCDDAPGELPDWLADRALALSQGSWQLLTRLGVEPACAPIRTVEVSVRGSAGRTRLDAAELGVPALGYVVRYAALHQALRATIARQAAPSGAAHRDPKPALMKPALTIVADGDTGGDASLRDFDQAALLATVRAQRPAPATAFERFTADGPLALLPLPAAGLWSLVWCQSPRSAQARAQLPAATFEAELRAAFGPALGALELSGERHVAPLQRRLRRRIVRGNEVAIGNAAQALHPVAGQGMNLGLRDAFVLAERLGEARARGAPPQQALTRFERDRRLDRGLTVAVTDTLATIFGFPLLRPLQSGALNLLDIVPPARRALTRTFMFGLRG